MKRLIVIGVAALGVASAWSVVTASRLSRPDKAQVAFQEHAAGRAAHEDAAWRISPGKDGVGIIVGAAICGDEAFLLDRQLGVVHRVDLPQGKLAGDIGPPVGALRFVTSLAVDCESRAIFVAHQDGVAAFEMDSGALSAVYRKPATFVHSLGAAVLDTRSQTLSVPGLWPQADSDWLIKPIDRMFEGDRIGYRLDLRSGRASPMLSAVERGCWSLGSNCVAATMAAVEGSASARWIAAHRVGMLAGVYDDQFRLIRTIDVRSPLFLETGRRNLSQRSDDMRAWGGENSVIRQLHAFDARVVTVHSVNRTTDRRDGVTRFDVFMNVHTLDGVRMVSDLRLPDIPVGRDRTSLYFVDYGPGGRRKMGRGPISLLRIPVDQ